MRHPLIVLDQDLRVVTTSRSFYEFFKVSPENTVGQLIYDLGNKQWDIPRLRELLETILPQKATFDNYEVEHDFTTIGKRIMHLNARQIQRVSGKEKIILLAIEDITERKEQERLLQQSENMLRIILNSVPQSIFWKDKAGIYLGCNNVMLNDMGFDRPEQIIGKTDFDLPWSKAEAEAYRTDDAEVITSGKPKLHIIEPLRQLDGRRLWIDTSKMPLLDGKNEIRGVLGIYENITERKEIEAGLEKTRKELADIKILADETSEFTESIINTVREPLISLDQNLRVVNASRSFYEFFKVKPEDTIGQLIYDLGNKQWNIPKLRELLETILPQKATFDNYEVVHDFTTIGKHIMLLNARQIQRVSGKEKIILLAIEDITERKEIEAGLKKAHDELEELTRELKRTAKVKSEFLANMSHELRTPLNSINGFSEVLYDETFGPLNDKQKKYVNNVLSSGRHLLLLINQILDMAKVEAGKMKLSLSNLPMKSLLNEISLLVADMANKKKLQMLLEIAEDLPDIEADELKVKEIMYNLLSNAVKFTPEGGNIGVRAKKAGSEIEIVVWDTGVGIASENMVKVFEGFFRVDTPYSRLTEGTGLGLPLSRKMVELHSGELSVESEGLNKGSSIRVILPIVSREVV